MLHTTILSALLAPLLFLGSSASADLTLPCAASITVNGRACCKVCTKGQACGDSCIAASSTCRKGPGCACNAGEPARAARAKERPATSSMYFILADIEGDGIEGDGPIGTWASNRLEPGQGLIMAGPPHGTEFSQWLDGSRAKAETRMSDPGARESADRVKQAVKR